MTNTPINPRALAFYNAMALAVSLQGAIDESQIKGRAKMHARNLYQELEKQLRTMYKATDPEIVVFHQISTMFDEIIRHLCNNDFMEEYEAKWAKIQEAIGNKVEVIT
ncbi:MAG TPA: hypothetical protein VIC51_12420 [Psychromonas sp.]